MSTTEIFFQRHGVSLWNRRAGTAYYPHVMEQFGIGKAAAERAEADPNQWNAEMNKALSECVDRLCREDPAVPPPADVAPLDSFFVDPPLTLEGKQGLRKAAAAAASAEFCTRPFEVAIVSPMLRTLQTAAIAAVHLPFSEQCRWVIDSDAREHNHSTWIDTWGTGCSGVLRQRAQAEIAADVGPAEAGACAFRKPLQQTVIEAAADGWLMQQAGALRDHADGIAGFCAAVNAAVIASEGDAVAAEREAVKWAEVVATDPEFRYRPQGSLDADQVVAKYSDDFESRWWTLDETSEGVGERLKMLLGSDAVQGGTGPVLIVTHSMLIRQAMDMLLADTTKWTGPAPMPPEGKLVSNGAIFRVLLDLDTGCAIEAGLFSP